MEKPHSSFFHPEAEKYITEIENDQQFRDTLIWDLQKTCSRFHTALTFCTKMLDGYLKPENGVTPGLDPTFYVTGDYNEDIKLLEQYKQVKDFLNKTK